MISGFNHINLTGKFAASQEYPLTGENREKVKNAILNRKPIMLSFEIDSDTPGEYISVLMTTSRAGLYSITSGHAYVGVDFVIMISYNTDTDSITLFYSTED